MNVHLIGFLQLNPVTKAVIIFCGLGLWSFVASLTGNHDNVKSYKSNLLLITEK